MYAMYLLVMCRSQNPPNFSEKKTVRIKIRYFALKTISYFWFPQGMIIFPGGVRQKRNFRRGGGSVLRVNFWKIQRGGGVIGKIPSVGGVWIFSGTTHCDSGYDVTKAAFSLPDLNVPKMKNAVFHAPETNRLSCACTVRAFTIMLFFSANYALFFGELCAKNPELCELCNIFD